MPSDPRAALAREHHRKAAGAETSASRHRGVRDTIVRQLYAEGGWTYEQLAAAVGTTKALIAKIVVPQDRS